MEFPIVWEVLTPKGLNHGQESSNIGLGNRPMPSLEITTKEQRPNKIASLKDEVKLVMRKFGENRDLITRWTYTEVSVKKSDPNFREQNEKLVIIIW